MSPIRAFELFKHYTSVGTGIKAYVPRRTKLNYGRLSGSPDF